MIECNIVCRVYCTVLPVIVVIAGAIFSGNVDLGGAVETKGPVVLIDTVGVSNTIGPADPVDPVDPVGPVGPIGPVGPVDLC